jgi:hypothetical protein
MGMGGKATLASTRSPVVLFRRFVTIAANATEMGVKLPQIKLVTVLVLNAQCPQHNLVADRELLVLCRSC